MSFISLEILSEIYVSFNLFNICHFSSILSDILDEIREASEPGSQEALQATKMELRLHYLLALDWILQPLLSLSILLILFVPLE